MKLLSIQADAKTVKGEAAGYITAIMYLAPYLSSGRNVCPMAKMAECHVGCLNTAGRGGIAKAGSLIATDGGDLPDNAIQHARIKRTELYWDHRNLFLSKLIDEIEAFIRKAERLNLTPVIRLNGTSDILWEKTRINKNFRNIMELFPDVQFYDYTKIAKRFKNELPANYHLTLSYSGASKRYVNTVVNAVRNYNANVAIVARDAATKARLIASAVRDGFSAVDGDLSDLRFNDPVGSLVILKAKGRARADATGFVVDKPFTFSYNAGANR